MTGLAFPSRRVGLRQALVTGRAWERFTERGLPVHEAQLRGSHAGGGAVFRTGLTLRPGGWFALHLDPARDMPDLAAAGAVTLTLTLRARGLAPVERSLNVTGADLALVEVPLLVAGQALTAERVAGAPFAFSVAVDPPPLLLEGLVLRDHDPAEPAAGVAVRANGADAAVTDAEGRFRIAALPLAESVTLDFDDTAATTTHVLRPDWGRRVLSATFSIPSA